MVVYIRKEIGFIVSRLCLAGSLSLHIQTMKVFRTLYVLSAVSNCPKMSMYSARGNNNENNMTKSVFCPLMRWRTVAEFNIVDYRQKKIVLIISHFRRKRP